MMDGNSIKTGGGGRRLREKSIEKFHFVFLNTSLITSSSAVQFCSDIVRQPLLEIQIQILRFSLSGCWLFA